MLDILEREHIQLVVLAGFLMILSPAFIHRYKGRILNVHPSLLPAFGGKGFYGLRVHQAALELMSRLRPAWYDPVDEQ